MWLGVIPKWLRVWRNICRQFEARRRMRAFPWFRQSVLRCLGAVMMIMATAATLCAEDGYELWLRYRPEPQLERRAEYAVFAGGRVVAPSRPIVTAAQKELERALTAIAGRGSADDGCIYLGTREDHVALRALVSAAEIDALGDEGFLLKTAEWDKRPTLIVAANTDRGVLHGTFALLRHIQLGRSLAQLEIKDAPRIRTRFGNHWDNPVRSTTFRSESIERGYAGNSIFNWEELPGRVDARLHDWARLLAAMGLNGVVINNVNTAKRGLEGWRLLTPAYLPKLVTLADILRAYGVRLSISVNFFSPILIDGMPTADPADPAVQAWWRAKADEIYSAIPDFGGFVVKADSEGEPGPMKYGRTHADGANLIAAALESRGGNVFWRAFVYDRTVGDRVTQAFGHFQPLDGKFAPNVYLQIKNGPLDFQVREPVSPLFSAMPATAQALELQITQEYTGQDKHVCFLGPMWSEVLNFRPRGNREGGSVADELAAIAGVMNVGDAPNWTGHLLAQANTYAFGRLAWNPALTPEEIAGEWTQLTFGRDPDVNAVVNRILLGSWRAFEDYTSPLGLGLLSRRVDHFFPDIANRKDYHGGNATGVGIDRTVASGTGYAGQYFEPWRSQFEKLEECPEELLLFLHHVPYTHRLKNGRTLIQELYDRHFNGVDNAREFLRDWETLRGKIDDERFEHVRERLAGQIGYAEEWCRAFNGYFKTLSGIPDEQRRPLP